MWQYRRANIFLLWGIIGQVASQGRDEERGEQSWEKKKIRQLQRQSELMNDSILVLVESNEQRFTKLNGNISVIQSVIKGMETEFTDIWSKVSEKVSEEQFMDLNNEVAHNISAVLQLLNNTRVDQKLIHAELLNFRNEVSQNISVALGSLNLEQMFSEISLNFTNINDKIGNINENLTTTSTGSPETTTMPPIIIDSNFPRRYLLIVGGYYSDKSSTTFGVRETEVVDVLSDISEGCGIRAYYPDGIHPFETGGDMVGENAVICGGYCRNEDCGNGQEWKLQGSTLTNRQLWKSSGQLEMKTINGNQFYLTNTINNLTLAVNENGTLIQETLQLEDGVVVEHQVWQKENQDINGFFKITPNAALVKVLAATLDDGLEITDQSESLSGALDECYSYDGGKNQWNLYATLKKPRYRFSHVMINKDTMWLTGGLTPNGKTSSTEFIYAKNSTKIGPHLPVPMAEHCVIKITEETILFIGGDSQIGLDATLFYDIASETFSEGPRLNHGRDYHSCAVFQSAQHNYRPVAIVAGGWVEDGNYSSTEILDFTVGNTWTNFVDIPSEAATTGESFVYGGRMVPTPDNTGVIMYSQTKFFQLICMSNVTCTWFVKTQTGLVAREDFPGVFYIPETIAQCV